MSLIEKRRSSKLSFQTYRLGPVIIDIEFFRISC